jgi:hypothetical protein
MGAPFFAFFAKGGIRDACACGLIPSLYNKSYSPSIIDAHPCKKRKDGEPSVEMLHIEMVKGGPPAHLQFVPERKPISKMNDMNDFPEVAYLQTDDFENWERKLQTMDDQELERHQIRLQDAIDIQAGKGGETKRLQHMLEACNYQRARLSVPREVKRELLVNVDGNIPFSVSSANTFSVPEVAEVRCQTCKKLFTIYCEDDDIADEELTTVKDAAEIEARKQFSDIHSRLGGHVKSMKISVRYLPTKKR